MFVFLLFPMTVIAGELIEFDWVEGIHLKSHPQKKSLIFFKKDGYSLTKIKSCYEGYGCDEYVFIKRE